MMTLTNLLEAFETEAKTLDLESVEGLKMYAAGLEIQKDLLRGQLSETDLQTETYMAAAAIGRIALVQLLELGQSVSVDISKLEFDFQDKTTATLTKVVNTNGGPDEFTLSFTVA